MSDAPCSNVSAIIAGHTVTVAQRDLLVEDFNDNVESSFFDDDFTIAASTGFFVWEGCWLLIDLLKDDLGPKILGKRVLELGAGTGLAGLCAAAIGGHVLLTDVKSVVTGMLEQNISSNINRHDGQETSAASLPTTCDPNTRLSDEHDENPWPKSVSIGRGTVGSVALDWTEEINEDSFMEDYGINPMEADVILAAECIWLEELVEPFVMTVHRLLHGKRRPYCLVCYRNRAQHGSETFVHMETVVERFKTLGCVVQNTTTRTVAKEKDKGTAGMPKEMIVYEVRLAS
eukprot:m.128099 g.128099  ORF g.128099 m.128099 type:complete len:288 (+) comp17417_c0_seq2:246-1109(+)